MSEARPAPARGGAGDDIWPRVIVDGSAVRARKEWLHTNGAGAYASSTLACMHTRRYHGLLVAALDPPEGRHVFLSHVDVTIARPRGMAAAAARDGGGPPPSVRGALSRWELGKHQFPGIDPDKGPLYLERFDQDPLPRWTYSVPLGKLEVTLALVRGENAAVLRYRWLGESPVLLTLRPLLAARGFHLLQREHGGMLQRVEIRSLHVDGAPASTGPTVGEMRVQPRKELPRICFRYEGTFVGSPDWWRRFEYLCERDRGVDFQEDLWTPGVFEVLAPPGGESYLVAAVEKLPPGEPAAMLAEAGEALLAEDPGPAAPRYLRRLAVAAEAFRADLARRPAVIAGYPWFDVWTRDTLLALPGLYLVPKKLEAATRVLRGLIATMKDGLIPNRSPAAPGAPGAPGPSASATATPIPGANSNGELFAPDVTLWFFEVARLMADALGDDHPFVKDELFIALDDAFEAALRGTRLGIHITSDGLFAVGAGPTAVTSMDERAGGRGTKLRAGCPIELSALWAKGCETLARLARAVGNVGLADRAAAACRRARDAFKALFFCEATGYPYDIISEAPTGEGAFRDATVRPYAVVALAVDPECFTPDQRARLLDRARRDLLTPFGLRTLAPSAAGYLGRCDQGAEPRDGSFHQGAVWPFLLSFFVRAAQRSGAPVNDLEGLLERLVETSIDREPVLGHMPELVAGDAPHAPAGCVAQAFNVAELLRAAAWDLTKRD